MYEKYLQQLEEAGKIRNLKERSITCYKNYVSYFLKHQGKDPEQLTCQDVRAFLLAKKDEGLKATTLNLYNSAIRFFYRNVLHILWDDITIPRMIPEHKLPTVLTIDEIERLLDAVDDIKYKAMFATMYSSGMRVSEVIHLHYDDISRTNMQIHAHAHQFRHAKASHWIEDGINVVQVSFLLGHEQLETTMRYLDITTEEKAKALATLESELQKSTPKKWKNSDGTLKDFCGLNR